MTYYYRDNKGIVDIADIVESGSNNPFDSEYDGFPSSAGSSNYNIQNIISNGTPNLGYLKRNNDGSLIDISTEGFRAKTMNGNGTIDANIYTHMSIICIGAGGGGGVNRQNNRGPGGRGGSGATFLARFIDLGDDNCVVNNFQAGTGGNGGSNANAPETNDGTFSKVTLNTGGTTYNIKCTGGGKGGSGGNNYNSGGSSGNSGQVVLSSTTIKNATSGTITDYAEDVYTSADGKNNQHSYQSNWGRGGADVVVNWPESVASTPGVVSGGFTIENNRAGTPAFWWGAGGAGGGQTNANRSGNYNGSEVGRWNAGNNAGNFTQMRAAGLVYTAQGVYSANGTTSAKSGNGGDGLLYIWLHRDV
jgi:hypothetical protein